MRGLEQSLSERHGRSIGTALHVRINHGLTVKVNLERQSQPLAARMCELAFTIPIHVYDT